MILTLKPGADAAAVRRALAAHGLWVDAEARGTGHHLVIAAHSSRAEPQVLAAIEGVLDVCVPASAHPRVDAQGSQIKAGPAVFGGERPVLMAGPCAVESADQISRLADRLAKHGVSLLRGGAFKPRTSPDSFAGHGTPALEWMRRAADAAGLGVVTEVLAEADAPRVAEVADLVQIGARNMQNFALLKAVGRTKKPVLLKRALSATVEEWLLAGEHLLAAGCPGVVFCERGVRGFDGSTRNLLDLGALALVRHVHRLPVVADPSHAAGRRDLVVPLARAALAAGANGLLLEVHDDPGRALSDGPQALNLDQLAQLTGGLA